MIKSIVFYIQSGTLCEAQFVRHEEAVAYANKVGERKGVSSVRLVSVKSSGELYIIDCD